MISKSIFPKNVIEVIDFIESGPLLETPYTAAIPKERQYNSMKKALKNYTNQDVKDPYYFLLDITSTASGEIPVSPEAEDLLDLKYQLIEYDEQEDFFNITLKKLEAISKNLDINKAQLRLLADAISGDLYMCAKSRLFLKNPHPYFERYFDVYKNQGFPCGWTGGENWKSGDFLIFTRS